MNLTTIRELVNDDFIAVNEHLDACLRSEIKLIPELGHHLIDSGGKRLRPLLVLLSAKACGYQGKAHIELAAIIEMIHSATLLHDDVVDASELRRGKKTANAIWGNTASILVGDYLYSRAFQMMVHINDMTIMQVLADATNTIAEGEILQLLNCKNPNTTEAEYMKVIRAKTGTLFATATQMGPVLCKLPAKAIEAIMLYGLHIGIAFQLIDDALDYSTDAETMGKNPGDDLAEGKPTLPLLYALHHGTAAQQTQIRHAIQNASRENLADILTTIESTQAIAYTYELANQQIKQAVEYLNAIPDSPYRVALKEIAQFAVSRSH
jgi:octaprenyl-diphosphate synthase